MRLIAAWDGPTEINVSLTNILEAALIGGPL